jgi:putative transposase
VAERTGVGGSVATASFYGEKSLPTACRAETIQPKDAIAQVVGFIRGKSAIHLARNFGGRQRNFVGRHFWARGYYVSTAGRDEEIIRRYIREQQVEDKRVEQLKMFAD